MQNTRPEIWDSGFFQSLNPSQKMIFLYLLSNVKANSAGIYEITLKRIACDTGFDEETIKNVLTIFADYNKIHRVGYYIIVVNRLKYCRLNQRARSSIEKVFSDLPEQVKSYIYSKRTLYNSLIKNLTNAGIAPDTIFPDYVDRTEEEAKQVNNFEAQTEEAAEYEQTTDFEAQTEETEEYEQTTDFEVQTEETEEYEQTTDFEAQTEETEEVEQTTDFEVQTEEAEEQEPGGIIVRPKGRPMSRNSYLIKWNTTAKEMNLPLLRQLTNEQKDKIGEAQEDFLFDFDKILAKIKDVEILKGKEPEDGWQLTFDWLLIEKNYRSILDGTFDPFSARYNLNMDDHLLPEKRIRGDYGQELNAVGELLEDEHNKKIFEFDPQLFFDKAEVLEQFRELITSVHGSPATVEKFKEEKSRRENSLNKKIRSGKKFKLKKSEAEKSLN